MNLHTLPYQALSYIVAVSSVGCMGASFASAIAPPPSSKYPYVSSVSQAIAPKTDLQTDLYLADASATDSAGNGDEPFSLEDLLTSKVVIAVLAAVAGAGMKYAFDEFAQANLFKRNMIDGITKSIDELAKEYYWLLANDSSVLSGLLESYLREREQKQLTQYETAQKAQAEFAKSIDRYGEDAFYYYSRLMRTIYNFQWVTGNTYFLKNYDSGRTLTKLYNRWQTCMKDIDANEIIDRIVRERPVPADQNAMPEASDSEEDTASIGKGQTIDTLRVFKQKLNKEDLQYGARKEYKSLQKQYEHFKEWMAQPEDVWQVSSCLKAYSDLFNAELGILYKNWFSKKMLGRNISAGISKDVLALISSQDSRDALKQVASEPLTLRPIGLSTPQAKLPTRDVGAVKPNEDSSTEKTGESSFKSAKTKTDQASDTFSEEPQNLPGNPNLL